MNLLKVLTGLVIGCGLIGRVVANADSGQTVTLAIPYTTSKLTNLKQVKKLPAKQMVTLDLILKPQHSDQLESMAMDVNSGVEMLENGGLKM